MHADAHARAQLEGEEPLTFSRLVCMDGNNSLKRLATRGDRVAGDLREFKSNYYLSREFVDSFANEVRSNQRQAKPDLPDRSHDANPGPVPELPGDPDPTTGDPAHGCAGNWKAAAADKEKKMWGIFDETGIFVCACRHSIVIYVVDMVKTGER